MHPVSIRSTRHHRTLILIMSSLLVIIGAGSLLATRLAYAAPPDQTDPAASPAPCYHAALAALAAQGAIYSQGGYLPDDPINPTTGQPYPRLGPESFDCSGLVSAAYAHAGVTIGTTTATQLTAGEPISCTLADLHDADTTCWALGDLMFLVYGDAGLVTGPGA